MTASEATYRVYEGADGFAQLQDAWEALEPTGADHFFQTHEYLRLWMRTIGTPTGAEPLLIALTERDRVVGIFPACRVRESGVPMLTWLGGPQTLDYGDVLFDAQAAETPVDEFVAESLRLLGRHARGSVLYLPNVRGDARAIEPLSSRLRVFRESAAPYVPITGTWEEYIASCGRSVRRNLNRAQRRLAEEGELEFRISEPGEADVLPAVSRLIEFKRERYDSPGTRTNLFEEHHVRFRIEQATTYSPSRVATITLNGKVIAANLNMVWGGRLYCLVTGFDEEFSTHSPGLMIEGFCVRSSFENGWDPCDFCSGDEAHKYLWTDCSVKLTTFVGDDVKGALFSAAAATRRRVADVLSGTRKKPERPSESDS